MSNLIKYSTTAQTQALKTGDFWIATGDVLKGSTSTSGFWNGISPPTSGYTIYLNKASQGPSIYVPTSDSQLIDYTNKIGTQSFTSVTQCFNWYNTQSDTMVFNKDYPAIITSGLVLNLDATFRPSYSTSGTTWYDLSPSGNNGTLTNGPTYSSSQGGSIVFDGTDDYSEVTNRNTILEFQPNQPYSFFILVYNLTITNGTILSNLSLTPSSYPGWDMFSPGSNTIESHLIANWTADAIKLGWTYNYSSYSNRWMYLGITYNGSVPTNSTDTLNSMDFYINGILSTTGKVVLEGDGFNSASSTITYNTSQRFRVASRWQSGSILQGKALNVSNVQVYNRKLSSAEILQNFYGSNIVTSGLVLYLDAGNIVSYPQTGTAWYDISSGGNNGTLINGPTFDSANGGSIVFDGTNDYVTVNDVAGVTDFTISQNYTVEFWFYMNSTQGGDTRSIVEKWSEVAGYPYIFRTSGNPPTGIVTAVWNGTTSQNITVAVNNNTWVHICVTFSWSTSLLTFYRNAQSAGTTPLTLTGNIDNTSPLNLMRRGNGLYYANGEMGSFRIYNRALTAAEVLQNYNATRTRFCL